jgi:hypothetical protein
MGSSSSRGRSGSSAELLPFSLPLTPEDSRWLDEVRYAHPLPFEEYLEWVSLWSDEWVRRNGMRGPDERFSEPFAL